MSGEKRQFPRVGEATRVTCRVLEEGEDGGAGGDAGLAVNISGGGICFRVPDRLEPGRRVALEVALPEFPSGIIALAHVVWCDPASGGGFEVGCEFHWVGWDSGAAQQRIADFIRSKLEG